MSGKDRKNSEGYSDPTAYAAIRNINRTHDRAWAWHIGLFLCVEPKSTVTGKRDIYLFFCLGMHDFSIGMITKFDEDEE